MNLVYNEVTMKGIWIIVISILILSVMGVLLYYSGGIKKKNEDSNTEASHSSQADKDTESEQNDTDIGSEILSENIPLKNWSERITKKPFGILISPETSPVQPENFSGYHTGTDFEIFDSELETEVEVKAICDGEVVESRYINGYGGVTMQSCTVNDKKILVLYGHVDISNAKSSIGTLKKGETISILADDNSYFSDKERKHLHLGIIDSQTINYKGYVESESLLVNWLDFEKLDR